MNGLVCSDVDVFNKNAAVAVDSLADIANAYKVTVDAMVEEKEKLGTNIEQAVAVLKQMSDTTDKAQEDLAISIAEISNYLKTSNELQEQKVF